ncbi:hypothetical protein DICVIV_12964 [Dictyocaulus viviparus]|uniref:Uncharacterized protein n=1 Tax=Dictyocaulus viviparus TaxID=29172 RepID=A0A0D8X905_DICVI|nr:hypothetical protein DICVIV_12964 [Dictyocaulus viviparus]
MTSVQLPIIEVIVVRISRTYSVRSCGVIDRHVCVRHVSLLFFKPSSFGMEYYVKYWREGHSIICTRMLIDDKLTKAINNSQNWIEDEEQSLYADQSAKFVTHSSVSKGLIKLIYNANIDEILLTSESIAETKIVMGVQEELSSLTQTTIHHMKMKPMWMWFHTTIDDIVLFESWTKSYMSTNDAVKRPRLAGSPYEQSNTIFVNQNK